MAVSANKSTSLSCSSSSYDYTLKSEFTENSINTTNNTSSITCKATLSGSNVSFSSSGGGILRIYWHDNNTNSDRLVSSLTVSSCGRSYGSKSTSGTINVTHKNDGTLSGYAKATWTKEKSNGYIPYSGNVSTNNTALTKINRYPTIRAASNFTDEENPTMTWTTYSTYPLRAKMEVGTNYSFITRDLDKSASVCTFTLTNEERDRLIDAAGDNTTLPVRFTICAMRTAGGTENDELSWSYLDRTMTVTPKGRIGKNGAWKRVQIYYGKNGSWKRCTPYIGKNGTWKRVK